METTVLIADDHPLFREALRLVVAEALGPAAITLECASLHEAREQVELHPGIELALMDLNMPGMNGIEFIKEVRKLAPYRFMPILFQTTESQQSKRLEAKAAGASGWLVKPVTATDLLNTIKLVMR